MPTIDLSDGTLFGNEAAEDEHEDIFKSYALERREIINSLDHNYGIQIFRAYKGEGKSALLRLIGFRAKLKTPAPIVISVSGAAISPLLTSTTSDEWVRRWKENILRLVVREIGATISFAATDDAIALVEEAEANGFKSRSFVSTVVDRLSSKAIPIERTRQGVTNPEQTLKRWKAAGSEVWLIIDDIDQNFVGTPDDKLKIATFFIAIRQIVILLPELSFRLAVRPNIWAIIKREFEGLSHVEQYIVDLSWTLDDFRDLLAKRIEGYLERNAHSASFLKRLPAERLSRSSNLIAAVFDDPMPWGNKNRQPIQILYTLSRHRPRWVVELCKVAGAAAKKSRRDKINFDDIVNELESFGRRRIDDTIAEFSSQCPQIEELLTAFVDQKEWMTTDELMTVMRDRILQGVHPKIAGVVGSPSAREVARFLYQIGFLTARKDSLDGSYEHIAFAENQSLLATSTNIDQGHSWEVHPVFRQVLNLKNVSRQNRGGSRRGPH